MIQAYQHGFKLRFWYVNFFLSSKNLNSEHVHVVGIFTPFHNITTKETEVQEHETMISCTHIIQFVQYVQVIFIAG
jgi:hypothetical protein